MIHDVQRSYRDSGSGVVAQRGVAVVDNASIRLDACPPEAPITGIERQDVSNATDRGTREAIFGPDIEARRAHYLRAKTVSDESILRKVLLAEDDAIEPVDEELKLLADDARIRGRLVDADILRSFTPIH